MSWNKEQREPHDRRTFAARWQKRPPVALVGAARERARKRDRERARARESVREREREAACALVSAAGGQNTGDNARERSLGFGG